MKPSASALPLILAFSPAAKNAAKAKDFFPRLASAAQQGEGKGEGHEYASRSKPLQAAPALVPARRLCEGFQKHRPVINLAGKKSIHPYPPANEATHVCAAPHPDLLPGGKNAASIAGNWLFWP
jgi:hypothetical protein